MGGKRTRPGQCLYLYIASMICLGLGIAGCASSPTTAVAPPPPAAGHEEGTEPEPAGARRHLLLAHDYFQRGNYKAAIRENEAVLSLSSGKPPADEALFNLGVLSADPANQSRNYGKAVSYFRQIPNRFPQSDWVRQSRIWTEVLQELIRMRQSITEALRENDRLRKVLEQSRKIDVETGERMRGKAR